MASPFPGMNRYLEDPAIWPGVHTRLITAIGDAINASASGRYFADIEERVYVLDQDDPAQRLFLPDVSVRDLQPNEVHGNVRVEDESSSGGVVTLVAPVRAAILGPLQYTERRIVIRALDDARVVTVIEVLSPTNKTRGSDGRAAYLKTRAEVLNSEAHFIEIDLRRGGTPMPAAVDVVFKKRADYRIVLSRATDRPIADWWLIGLPHPVGATPRFGHLPARPAARHRPAWDTWMPAVVLEVVSPRQETRDYDDKRADYLAAGVLEHWIIDPKTQSMLVLQRRGDVWVERRVKRTGRYRAYLLPGFEFELKSVLAAGKQKK